MLLNLSIYLKYKEKEKKLLELKAQQLRNLNSIIIIKKLRLSLYYLRPYEAALCNGT